MATLFSLVILSAVLHSALGGGCEFQTARNGISCVGISDSDLPFVSGTSSTLSFIKVLASPNLTTMPTLSFAGAVAEAYFFEENENLAVLEGDFLGSWLGETKELNFNNLPMLTEFDWAYLSAFPDLESFTLTATGISALASDIPWPASITAIDLSRNQNIVEIPTDAFLAASALSSLNLEEMSQNLILRTRAFHTTSTNDPVLTLTSTPNPNLITQMEEDVFGDVGGGQLWDRLDIAVGDFPEMSFRLMIKSAFDSLKPELITTMLGVSQVSDCSNCSIAWLYKDAQQFGAEAYIGLVGTGNVECPGFGPVLQSDDEDFNQQMRDCPATPMPWPDNPCEGHSGSGSESDTVADSETCSCFYHCSADDEVLGHDCCADGLVYNPAIGLCDWPYPVPGCEDSIPGALKSVYSNVPRL